MQVDISCCVPAPQLTEQGEAVLHDDQVGHDCVLQSSVMVWLEDPSSQTKDLV